MPNHNILNACRKAMHILCAALLCAACKPGIPNGVIKPSKMQKLLYDYHVAQSMAENAHDSVNFRRYSYVQAVFDKYNVTAAEFDSSMVWYSTHATYLNDFYKDMRKRYEEEVSLLGIFSGDGDIYANLNAQGDTANIWSDRTFHVLTPRYSENRFTFSMEADTTFVKGDVLIWRFATRYVSLGKQGEAYAGFYIKFDNDSTAGVALRIYSRNQMELRLDGDTAHQIVELGGFVYYKPPINDNDPRLLLLNDMMLVRMHPEVEIPDTMPALTPDDSLRMAMDSAAANQMPDTTHRLSPTQLRDSRPVEHSINVVKEKPYIDVRKTKKNRNKKH